MRYATQEKNREKECTLYTCADMATQQHNRKKGDIAARMWFVEPVQNLKRKYYDGRNVMIKSHTIAIRKV